LLTGCSL